jgi:hypothetical protein
MSLGEERVYQTLWHARESDGVYIESKKSKTFSLGYDRIARLVRLNEKSVRVLLPKLIAKKILEVLAAEDSAHRTGRTYRIFNYEEILDRQRAANLTNVVKSGRAVEFVWPARPTVGETTTVHARSEPPCGPLNPSARSRSAVGESPTVGATPNSPVDEAGLRTTQRYPLELASRVRAILSTFDDDALYSLWSKCVQQAPDCTAEEVEYCLQLKAQQLLGRGKTVTNPIGLMLAAVPRCFEGPSGLHLAFREQKRAQEELRRQAEAEFKRQIDEYRRLAQDPSTSPEDRAWYEELISKIK